MQTGNTDVSKMSCPYCGNLHLELCPRIKSIDYYPNGTVKHVELHNNKYDNKPLPYGMGTTSL